MPTTRAQKRSRSEGNIADEHHDELVKRPRMAGKPPDTRFSPRAKLSAEIISASDHDDASSSPSRTVETRDNSYPDYNYKPFDSSKNEIRLLHIYPNPGSLDGAKSEMVHAALFHVSLDDPPPFEALSYTWGSYSNRSEIILDGNLISVTKNLGDALQHLQSSSTRRSKLWVDALCINQKDLNERNEQIKKMRTIYYCATRVISWLGPPDESTKLAFSLLRQLKPPNDDGVDHRSIILDPSNFSCWKGLMKFWQHPYWLRIWVVQELAMAKKILIVCGEDSINWIKLTTIQKVLRLFHMADLEELVRRNPVFKNANRWIGRGAILMISDLSRIFIKPPSLLQTITSHQSKNATNPKDKVYALVGLTTARDHPEQFVVDYFKSVREVYTDVVKYDLSTANRLDIICRHPRRNQKFKLPSWVPDWSYRFEFGNPFPRTLTDSQPEASFSNHGRILVAKGYCLDKIAAVSEESKSTGFITSQIPNTILDFHSWRNFFKASKGKKGYSTTDDETFCRTIVVDMFGDGTDLNRDRSEAHREVLRCFSQRLKQLHPTVELDETLVKICNGPMAEWVSESQREDWENAILKRTLIMVWDHRFIISSEGRVGLARDAVKQGDLICILFGCAHPVILRPRKKGGGFILLSAAHIDRYTNKMANEDRKSGKYKLQNFRIH